MPLQDGERIFIDAMRELNHQAIIIQAAENCENSGGDDSDEDHDHKKSRIDPHEEAITAVILAAQRMAQVERTYDTTPFEWQMLRDQMNVPVKRKVSIDEPIISNKKNKIFTVYQNSSDSE